MDKDPFKEIANFYLLFAIGMGILLPLALIIGGILNGN